MAAVTHKHLWCVLYIKIKYIMDVGQSTTKDYNINGEGI
jgi:hypothetical protein